MCPVKNTSVNQTDVFLHIQRIISKLSGTLSAKGECLMKPTKKEYDKMTKKASPPSPKLKNSLFAFCIGGLVCTLGQVLLNLYIALGITKTDSKTLVSVTLIGLTAFFTALHLYEKYANIVIDCDEKNIREIVTEIAKRLS